MRIGIVVEGFNEGERLTRCLSSLRACGLSVVYVDSGSTDGSVEYAASQGCHLVSLDVSQIPFNCSRARNAGFLKLLDIDPSIDIVQFVDADCEVSAEWLGVVTCQFTQDRQLGVLCGRLTERERNSSIYSRLCDMEWDGPLGEVPTCGGIAAMRADIFERLGGFREDLGGDEEIELCTRFRGEGFHTVRVADHMATHDAGMVRFSQWWRRAVKHGSVYAQAVAQGRSDSYKRRQLARAVVWGGILPAGAVLGTAIAVIWPAALVLPSAAMMIYAALAWRASAYRRRRGSSVADSWLYGAFCVVGNVAHFTGCCRYLGHRNVILSATAAPGATRHIQVHQSAEA